MAKYLNAKVGVLLGGRSAEREVSLKSGAAVAQALRNRNYQVVEIDPASETWIALLEQVDVVFIALHGPGGEDGAMQGFLQLLGKPYTGSGVQASAVAMDKLRTKQVWQSVGLPTPPYEVLTSNSDVTDLGLEYPVFVKPINEGSSIGMSRVARAEQLREACARANNQGEAVLVEQAVIGDEYTVAVLDGSALPAIKLETDHDFYDFDAKYLADDTRYICPCGLSTEDEARIGLLAADAFKALGCRGWGRVDVMRAEDGEFYLLEINTVPGMTSHSLVPMAAKQAGMSFDSLVEHILEAAQ